jgi:GMP synthase (glutamine-hydrolysing)
LPQEAVALATSSRCHVQAFKYAERVYATQFHPELDLAGLATRIEVYRNAGYFPPEDAAELIEVAGQTHVVHPMKVLHNFVALAAGGVR